MTPTPLTVTDRTLTIVAGYEAQPEGTAEPVETRWLYDEDCQPPCWEYLVPGETKLDDAAALLTANPDFEGVQLDHERFPSILWDGRGVKHGVEEIIPEEGDVVYRINVTFQSGVSVQDVPERFGDPSYVRVVIVTGEDSFDLERRFSLIYPFLGFEISGDFTPVPSDRIFSEDLLVDLYL